VLNTRSEISTASDTPLTLPWNQTQILIQKIRSGISGTEILEEEFTFTQTIGLTSRRGGGRGAEGSSRWRISQDQFIKTSLQKAVPWAYFLRHRQKAVPRDHILFVDIENPLDKLRNLSRYNASVCHWF
jgi:hypothetical protein